MRFSRSSRSAARLSLLGSCQDVPAVTAGEKEARWLVKRDKDGSIALRVPNELLSVAVFALFLVQVRCCTGRSLPDLD